MRRILALAVAALALAANAEWKTVCTVQVADTAALAQGITKLGEFTGNAMLGIMAASSLNNFPGSAAFGPGRKGADILYPVFVENGRTEFAVLYPVAITKAAFMKKWPGAVESNGLIRAKCPMTGKTAKIHYAAFSGDGKWVGFSDQPQQARLALKEIETAERTLDGDMVRVRILKHGLDEIAKDGEKAKDPCVKDFLAQLSGFIAGIRVSERGLDIRGVIKPVPDTELAKIGRQPLAADPLAFAGKDALVAYAVAPNCGYTVNKAEMWKEIKASFERDGIKSDWLGIAEDGVNSKVTLDLAGLIAGAKLLEEEADDDVQDNLSSNLTAIVKRHAAKGKGVPLKAEGPALGFAFALKDYEGKVPVAERFAATLPEVADKQPVAVGFTSIYSILRTLVQVVAKADPDRAAEIEPVMQLLPGEGKGGIALSFWNERSALRFFLRVGADEFKAVSAGIAAFAAFSKAKESDDDEDAGCDECDGE